jgi:hypothetical protein
MNRVFKSETQLQKLEPYVAVGLIILVAGITYLPLASKFGFYLDDWYILWGGNNFGPSIIAEFHQFDRPLWGQIYALNFALLGNNPINWQLFTWFVRVAGVMAFFWSLRMIWPEQKALTTSAALLFLVYPGFLQQPNAHTYSNHLISLSSAMLSISLTIRAALAIERWKIIGYQLLSTVFAITYLFYVENMVGLEVLRWVFLWLALQSVDKIKMNKYAQWFLYALPTLLVTGAMVIWRAFIFESGRQSMNFTSIIGGFSASKLHTIIQIIAETSRDFFETAFSAWFVPGYHLGIHSTYRDMAISVLLGFIAATIYFGYAYWQSKNQSTLATSAKLGWILTFIGIICILSALLPVVVVGRQVYLDLVMNGFNRYTLQSMAGVSILIVGLVVLGGKQKTWMWIFAFLIGIAVYTHFHNGIRYQTAWQYQRDFWWQLTWRAPDIIDDTVLVVVLPSGYSFSEDYEIWSPANLIYRPGSQQVDINGQILTQETIDWIRRESNLDATVRGVVPYHHDYGNILVATIPDALSCLQAINGERLEDNKISPLIQLIYGQSEIELIDTLEVQPAVPPIDILGSEPEHRWCYYYQLISRSRQNSDWLAAADFADKARFLDYKPLNIAEWLPVFEAYANTGRREEARQISKIIRSDKDLRALLCDQMIIPPDYQYYDHEYIYSTLCENP